jgi:hypothetical protein
VCCSPLAHFTGALLLSYSSPQRSYAESPHPLRPSISRFLGWTGRALAVAQAGQAATSLPGSIAFRSRLVQRRGLCCRSWRLWERSRATRRQTPSSSPNISPVAGTIRGPALSTARATDLLRRHVFVPAGIPGGARLTLRSIRSGASTDTAAMGVWGQDNRDQGGWRSEAGARTYVDQA